MHKIVAFTFSLGLLVTACGGDDGHPPPGQPDGGSTPDATVPPPGPDASTIAPPLRNPVDMSDKELAYAAISSLGLPEFGSKGSCNSCHASSLPLFNHWKELFDGANVCLNDVQVSSPEKARKMIDCLRADPANPDSPFIAAKLGPYASAAHLDWFKFVFQRAYGTEAEAKYAGFRAKVGMPKGTNPPFTQAEFDLVAEWFARGLPLAGEILPGNPPPATCTSAIGPELAPHVAAMKLSGWGAVNKERNLLMHGCGTATNPRDCLTTYPRAGQKPYGAGWESLPGAVVRVLFETDYQSSYWTRSSPDGRYVGHGGNGSQEFGASVIDLAMNKVIPVAAAFDPGFFPDNSGFMFQGPGFLCNESVLAGATSIGDSTPGCSSTGEVGLYQHLGASLGGGDYWVVHGGFESDDGGKQATLGDPAAFFPEGSTTNLTPMVHTGNQFVPGTTVSSSTPYEGDEVISPSSRLIIGRLAGPEGKQRGYVLRKLVATPQAGGGYTVSTPEIARYCFSGAKPNFSFDERWIVTHHYVEDADAVELGFSGPNDPGFAAYREQGASNIVLVDLLTGVRKRVTRMKPGQYALFPHFRSDGWIYFLVRTVGETGEVVAASDAALVLQ